VRVVEGKKQVRSLVAVAEIVKLPRFVYRPSAAHDFLAHKHFDGTKIALEVPSVSVRLSQLRWCDLSVMLGCSRRAVAEPLLELELPSLPRSKGSPDEGAGDCSFLLVTELVPIPSACKAALCTRHAVRALVEKIVGARFWQLRHDPAAGRRSHLVYRTGLRPVVAGCWTQSMPPTPALELAFVYCLRSSTCFETPR